MTALSMRARTAVEQSYAQGLTTSRVMARHGVDYETAQEVLDGMVDGYEERLEINRQDRATVRARRQLLIALERERITVARNAQRYRDGARSAA